MTDPLDLDALAAMEAAATPGPWQVERGGDDQDLPGFREGLYVSSRAAVEQDDPPLTGPLHNPHDAWFLVEARNALPALIDRVRELEARIDAVRALMDDWATDDSAAGWMKDRLYAALEGDA